MSPSFLSLWSVALLWLLAGCGNTSADGPTAGTPPPDAADVALPGPEATRAKGATPAPRLARVALDTEGLRFVEPTLGSARLLAFGTSVDSAIAAVVRVRGEPHERGTQDDCALGFFSWTDGLKMYVAGGQFVGWAASAPTPVAGRETARAPTTMAGVGVGSSRSDLDGAYATRVTQTTLGSEFDAGGIYGVLSGPGPEGRVTAMWAGTPCVFR